MSVLSTAAVITFSSDTIENAAIQYHNCGRNANIYAPSSYLVQYAKKSLAHEDTVIKRPQS